MRLLIRLFYLHTQVLPSACIHCAIRKSNLSITKRHNTLLNIIYDPEACNRIDVPEIHSTKWQEGEIGGRKDNRKYEEEEMGRQ